MTTTIPAFHVSSRSRAVGRAEIFVKSRRDRTHPGTFTIVTDVHFDPLNNGPDYPSGSLTLEVRLNDGIQAHFRATSIELINSYGEVNPTLVFTGRCEVSLLEKAPVPEGCRYWVMIADNKAATADVTADVVGFAIHDKPGNRVAYGMGPVQKGDLKVSAA